MSFLNVIAECLRLLSVKLGHVNSSRFTILQALPSVLITYVDRQQVEAY